MTRESTAITVADSYNERIDSYIWGNILMSMRKKIHVIQVYRTFWFHVKTVLLSVISIFG